MGHSEQVSELRNSFFLQVHNKIKDSCYKEIRNSKSPREAMEILARTEELAGKMYHLLAVSLIVMLTPLFSVC